jgi:hypothetical protein
MRRIAVGSLAVLLLLAVHAPTANAAVTNDDLETATVLAEPFPFFEVANIKEATTSQFEMETCWGDHVVWYTFSALTDSVVLYNFQPTNGDFIPVIIEYKTGPAGSSTSCGEFFPVTQTRAAQVLAGEQLFLGIGAGGLGSESSGDISVYADVRPLIHISSTVNSTARVDKSGAATITGTVNCDAYETVNLHVVMKQKSGHGFITADNHNFSSVPCNPYDSSAWSISLQPTAGGKFVAGRAEVTATATCGGYPPYCTTSVDGPRTVKLTSSK